MSKCNQCNTKETTRRTLQATIRKVKQDRELGQRYMFLEDLLRLERKQAKIEGKVEGMIEAILEVLGEYGPVPEAVRSRITSQTDPAILSRMLKAAVKVRSLEEFEERGRRQTSDLIQIRKYTRQIKSNYHYFIRTEEF